MSFRNFVYYIISNIKILASMTETNLIGSGIYSIVTSPGILCSENWHIPYSNSHENDVFKIFYSDESKQDYEDEMKILSKIIKITNYDAFTAPVKGACVVRVNEIPSNIMKILLKYNPNIKNQETIYQIIFGYCGISLCKSNLSKMSYKRWLNILRDFFKGLQDIHENGIVHRDITPSNVLYDCESKSLKLIDFGIGIDATSVFSNKDDATFVLSSMYKFSPPEFYIAYQMHSRMLSESNFQSAFVQTFDSLTHNTKTLRNFYREHYWKHEESIMYDISLYAKGFEEIEKEFDLNIVQSVEQMFPIDTAYKCDVFAISLLLKYIQDFITFENEKEKKHFDLMVSKSSCFNPFKRMSMKDLISHIDGFSIDDNIFLRI